jgi:hypothetical protein
MADGILLIERVETSTIETAGGIAANLCVTAGAAAGACKVGTAALHFYGVTTEAYALNDSASIATKGVLEIVAGGVIPRLTSSKPTPVYMAASGKVTALPVAAGTYYRVGYMHNSSAAAGADGDIVSIEINPGVEVVPSSAYTEFGQLSKGPLANVAAGATVSAFIAKVPAGRAFTLSQVQAYNGTIGAAGATVDVHVDGASVLAAPVALTSSTVTAITAFATPIVAAGSVITLVFVGGAATGTIAAPEMTVFFTDAAA